MSDSADAGFGIYVHWPFCLSKCPYCDFNSHVADSIDQDRWRRALLTELEHYAVLTPDRRVSSLFFGGGTPSLMAPDTVAEIVAAVRRHWTVSNEFEITLEANPGTVDAARFRAFREAGIERLSMGVQSLKEEDLRFLGRRHSVEEALRAIALARDTFPRMSFDLIYARPGQDVPSWRAELSRALDHAAEHLSLYQLTIEPGTAFHPAHARGDFVLPDDDAGAALWDATQEICEQAGLPAYEISNHARPGAESRHNLVYWRGGDYVGIGPGAHGRLTLDGTHHALRQHRAPDAWLSLVESQGHATREDTPLSLAERRIELVMMGLRLREGLVRERFVSLAGCHPEEVLDAAGLADMISSGFVIADEDGIRTSAAGRPLLNGVLTALLP
ncbi:radical SAM family heme chaperone HemW [Telmatospirillum sp. J64-1]|uniref:radical SAM family heme chaperone HemW n=1 Tax=Telmatospirillum sp. J64-1 TaxID=2502183 RepID=UPI00115C805F|nr:radical SAM family heme chaperone HemW [Telmatospirillum sp. J64-1]